jgi:hypothetical protein
VRRGGLDLVAQSVHVAPGEGHHAVAALHLGQAGQGAPRDSQGRQPLVLPNLKVVP